MKTPFRWVQISFLNILLFIITVIILNPNLIIYLVFSAFQGSEYWHDIFDKAIENEICKTLNPRPFECKNNQSGSSFELMQMV